MNNDTKKNKILLKYFTNIDDNVYALKSSIPVQVGAAVISRCSRTNKPLRELFWEEFLKNPDLSLSLDTQSEDILDIEANKKAAGFFDRVLAQYGDESVGEMSYVSVIVEDVSPIALKVIESMRRMAFIEVSTRYVDFRSLYKNKYRYYVDKDVETEIGDEYTKVADQLFKKYEEWFEPIKEYVQSQNPILESEKEVAYKAAVHARTCDILRELLPFGIIANAGISGNGRDWSELINIMLSHNLEEVRSVGQKIQIEVGKIIPNIIQRSSGVHGISSQEYLKNIESIKTNEVKRLRPILSYSTNSSSNTNFSNLFVKILDISSDPLARVCASYVYESTGLNFDTLLDYYKFNPTKTDDVVNEIISIRQNRFHKVPECFESAKIVVEMFGPLSAWKDLQRHRRLTQYRSTYSLHKSFYVAPELIEMGLDQEYSNLMSSTMNWIKLKQAEHQNLYQALEYLTPHGANIRWVMEMDLAEAIYMIELRSASGGHVTYRKIMHLFYKELEKLDLKLDKLCTNVDLDEYYLGRRQSFNKVIEKGGTLPKF